MPSYPDKWTDRELAKLEKRIRNEYGRAMKDMVVILDAFVYGTTYINESGEEVRGKSLADKEAEFEELVKKGIKEPDDLKQWRLNQMGRQARYEAMRDKLADRLTYSNETALNYINDATPGIYCLNRNYEAYTIEQVAGASDFTLWDESTVRRLLIEKPDEMPYYPPLKALSRGIDLEYGKSQITKRITSGILRGASIPDIAKSLREDIATMGYVSSVRAARTAVTAAQNGGRMDTYYEAEKMGIKLQRQWLATLDGRTRHTHQLLDGQKARMGEKFHVDGMEIEYPGDPKAAPALVYNCRCTLIAAVEGRGNNGERVARTTDPETGKPTWEKVPADMNYQEWVKWKEAGKPEIVKEPAIDLSERRKQRMAARRGNNNAEHPAVTIPDFGRMKQSEIKQFISENIKTEFGDIAGVSKSILQETVNSVYVFEQKAGGNPVQGLKIVFGGVPSNAYAYFDDRKNILHLKKTGSISAFVERQVKDNERAMLKLHKPYHATTTFSGTVFHELGHAVDWEMGQSLSGRLSKDSALNVSSVKISVYAGASGGLGATKRSEAWAENFSAYMEGGESAAKVPKEIAEMIEDYFLKKRQSRRMF